MNEKCSNDFCSIHYRVDQLEINDDTETLISYIGEYVVVTGVAPEVATSGAMMSMMLGIISPENMYVTYVGWLGSETNSIQDSIEEVDTHDYFRFWQRHDDVDNLLEVHQMIVSSVKEELIDLGTPQGDQYQDECNKIAEELRMQALNNMPTDL